MLDRNVGFNYFCLGKVFTPPFSIFAFWYVTTSGMCFGGFYVIDEHKVELSTAENVEGKLYMFAKMFVFAF